MWRSSVRNHRRAAPIGGAAASGLSQTIASNVTGTLIKGGAKKAFLSTIAGKIAIVVSSILVIGGVTCGIIYYTNSQKDKDSSEENGIETEVSTEVQTRCNRG